MKIYVRLCFFFNWFSMLRICDWIFMLSVFVGLFKIIRDGLVVSVCVIVICCFCFLDNLCGNCVRCFVLRLILCINLSIWVVICWFVVFEWICRGLLIICLIVIWEFNELFGFWKMIWIFFWRFCILDWDNFVSGVLWKSILLFVGDLSLIMVFNRVFFLYFDLLMRLWVLFG